MRCDEVLKNATKQTQVRGIRLFFLLLPNDQLPTNIQVMGLHLFANADWWRKKSLQSNECATIIHALWSKADIPRQTISWMVRAGGSVDVVLKDY